MNTPVKEKQLTKNSIDKAVFVRAMAEMMMNLSPDQIKIPAKYRDQVLSVKELLKADTSGMVNTLLDFAITSALVDYNVETDNPELTAMFNNWMSNINEELRGQIPTGISALAKEYFRERWKGSSFIILRSVWEERDGFILPTKLWFVNGEDIVINPGSDTFTIGQESYSLRINQKNVKSIPVGKDERIFVQKPFESWGTEYPIPFIIRKGLFKNLRLLEILCTKGEYVVGKALEYLLVLKKGTENLALSNSSEFTYSAEDLTKIKTQMEEILTQRRSIPGTPTYATNFDTDIEHLIPEYDKALKQELFTPIERRIMAGLGLIDVLQGVASTRKESMMNPRPFIAEVECGIADFKQLFSDILQTIIQLNRVKHPKYIGRISHINSTPISQFMTDKIRDSLQNMYDRGIISKRTYAEVVGEVDFDIEVQRREVEKDEGLEDVMFPPVINNIDEQMGKISNEPPKESENKTPTKEKAEVLEVAMYKTVDDLPSNVKDVLPKSAQAIWMKVFNDSFPKGEDYARKVAWTVIKKLYKKVEDKWELKKKVKGMAFSSATAEGVLTDVMKLQDLQLKEAQLKLITRFLKEEEA